MPNQVCLESAEDLQWLSEVHGVPTEGIVIAILVGNEDSPNRVELYTQNDYRCVPIVYEATSETHELGLLEDQTVWVKFECGAGNRWTSPLGNASYEDVTGQICNFSGCGCGTPVRICGSTANRREAAEWFKRIGVI